MYYKKLVAQDCYLSPMDIANETETMTTWLNEDQDIAYFNGFYGSLLGKEKIEAMMHAWNEGPFSFSIVNKETDEFMGHISLFGMDKQQNCATMGIYLGKPFRGKGYGQQAMKLLTDYVFNTQRFQAIHLEVFGYNERAIQSYKKFGFVECGRWHKAKYHLGEYYDIVLMEYLRP